MKKSLNKKLVLGVAIFGMFSLSGTTALHATDVDMPITSTFQSAGEAVLTENMEFGTVILDPTSATITIAASGLDNTTDTRATPANTAGNSSFVGVSGSGVITVTSPIEILVSVTPDDTATIASSGGNTLPISGIIANSTNTYTHTAGSTSYVHVGGILTIADSGGVDIGEYNTTNTNAVPLNVTVDFQ